MPHDHGMDMEAAGGDRRVGLAIAVNLGLTVVQIVAGVLSGSLALVADAIHNLSDALSLVIAFLARRIARRPADARMTFGYGRAEVVAALVNYTSLILIALYLVYEGILRLLNPQGVDGWIVVIVAGVALVIDTVTALLIYSMSKGSVNIRAAFLHNVADALGSIAVIVAGTLILLYDWRLVDPLVTLGIAGYILWQSAAGIGPVVRILMLASPDDADMDAVLATLRETQGVQDVHHVHLWRMQEHETALEAHVVLAPEADMEEVKARVRTVLHDRHDIEHATLEVERPDAPCNGARVIGH